MMHTIKEMGKGDEQMIMDYLYEPELWARINEGKGGLVMQMNTGANIYWLGLYYGDKFCGVLLGDGVEKPASPMLHICLQKKDREHKYAFSRLIAEYFKGRVESIRTTVPDNLHNVVKYCEASGMHVDSESDGKVNMILEFK